MSTPVTSMLWVVGSGVIGSVGAVGLKSGAQRLHLNLRSLATNWPLLGGIGLYLFSSVLFVKGQHGGQLSVLFPLVALGQIWTMLWARFFFREHITRYKLIAVALILAGVGLIAYGNSLLADLAKLP